MRSKARPGQKPKLTQLGYRPSTGRASRLYGAWRGYLKANRLLMSTGAHTHSQIITVVGRINAPCFWAMGGMRHQLMTLNSLRKARHLGAIEQCVCWRVCAKPAAIQRDPRELNVHTYRGPLVSFEATCSSQRLAGAAWGSTGACLCSDTETRPRPGTTPLRCPPCTSSFSRQRVSARC